MTIAIMPGSRRRAVVQARQEIERAMPETISAPVSAPPEPKKKRIKGKLSVKAQEAQS